MRPLAAGMVLVVTLVRAAGAAAVPSAPEPSVTEPPEPDPCWTVFGGLPPPDCPPQPTPPDPDGEFEEPLSPAPLPADTVDDGGDDGPGGVTGWIMDGISNAINNFFRDLVTDALNPLLDLLGRTLLTTPPPESLPVIGQLWENSRTFAVAAYVLLVMVAGLVLMAHETVQTRYSVKQIAPRVVIGFLVANLSLLFAGQAIAFANAASRAVLGEGVDADQAAEVLTTLVMGALSDQGIFVIFIGLALAAALVALLVTYVVRVALTVILIAGAPLALACHGLPQTEGVAYWWWRTFFGVLAIQVAQSLVLVTALRVFFAPGGFSIFGPTTDGLVNLIVSLSLFYILFKIPFWILQQVQVSRGRSFVGGLVKGYIAYKTFGLFRGHGRGGHQPHPRPPRGSSGPPPSTGGPRTGPSYPTSRGPGGRPPSQPPAANPSGSSPGPSPQSPPPRATQATVGERHLTVGHRVVPAPSAHASHEHQRLPDEPQRTPGEHRTSPGQRPLPRGARHPRPQTSPRHDTARGYRRSEVNRHRLHTSTSGRRTGWPTLGHVKAGADDHGPRHAPVAAARVPVRRHGDHPARSTPAAPVLHVRQAGRPHTPDSPARMSRPGGEPR